MTDVVMPQMGESIVEGTLTKWLKKPGERVERDEPLFEISTDKVDTEIPSPAAGHAGGSAGRRGQDGGDQHRGGAHRARAPRRRRSSPRRLPNPRPRCARRSAPRPHPAAEPAAPQPPEARRSALAAGAQDGARKQHRSQPGEGHRRRRTHHQAGRGRLHCSQASAASAPRAPPRRPPAQPRRRHRLLPATPATAAARRRTGQDAHRADEHHARQDRRAHGASQAHLGARHHHSKRGHDQSGSHARSPQGRLPSALRLRRSPTCRSWCAPP